MRLFWPVSVLVSAIQRVLGRRAARRLRALGLPSAGQAVAGLLPGPRPALALALRTPGPLAPPEGSLEYWALPTGAHAIRSPGAPPGLLLRLLALPPPRRPLGVLRLAAFGLDETGLPRPQSHPLSRSQRHPLPGGASLLRILEARDRGTLPAAAPASMDSGVRPSSLRLSAAFLPAAAARPPPVPDPLRHAWARGPKPREAPPRLDLGAARLDHFGLDESGRLASERDLPESTFDRPAPPPPGRYLRPRTPLARAPLARFSPRGWRLDPRTLEPANEQLVPHRRELRVPGFRHDALFRAIVDPRWMSLDRLMGLGPMGAGAEWFVMWWEQVLRKKPGAWYPEEWDQPPYISWAMDRCKEQMLIRRDVKKDEEGPKPVDYQIWVEGPQILAHEKAPMTELIEDPDWVEPFAMPPVDPREVERPAADAYLQWRTLLDGLEER